MRSFSLACFLFYFHTSRALYHHAQIRLPWNLLVLILMLFLGMSPNSCSGAYANAHPPSHEPCRKQYESRINLALSPFASTCPNILNSATLCPKPQHFRRNPDWSSKAPSTHASNGPPKAIAPTVRMERSRNGMSQV